jgi:hypothetical protein
MINLAQKLKEFEGKVYESIESDKNPRFKGIKLPDEEKYEKLKLKEEYKNELNKAFDNFYISTCDSVNKCRLNAREQNSVINATFQMFLNSLEHNMDFLNLEFDNYPEKAIESIVSDINLEKQNYSDFLENASKSEDPFKYIKTFLRTNDLEKVPLLHSVIKGRNEIKKVCEYARSAESGQIKDAVNGVFNLVPGSAKELIKLANAGMPEEYDFFLKNVWKGNEEKYARYLLRQGKNSIARIFEPTKEVNPFEMPLKQKGFILEEYRDGKFFLAELNSAYQINGSLTVYGTNNRPKPNIGGFFNNVSKRLFVCQKNNVADVIQHELEHFIQDSLKMTFAKYLGKNSESSGTFNRNLKMREYGAYLAEIKFSKDPQNAFCNILENQLYGRLMQRLQECDSNSIKNHGEAVEKIKEDFGKITSNPHNLIDKNLFKKHISQLHDRLYQNTIGITYAKLENLCGKSAEAEK